MKSPILISSIVSVDKNRGIGKENKIPWNIPKDRKWFKEKTLGHVVIMGRNTFDSILEYLHKPLPERINIVVTNTSDEKYSDVYFVDSLEKALDLGKRLEKNGEIFFIGGGKIYSSSIKFAKRVYITEVEGNFDCDTFFPDYSDFKKEIFSQKDSDNGINFISKILERE
jgi:dihydrofolate reductase